MSIREDYQNKANRDAAAKEYKAQGYTVTRRSWRGQYMHPMYIKDWTGAALETGFGNTQYQTFFAVVYSLEAR